MMGSGVCLSGGLSWSLSLFLGDDLVTGNISLEDITVAKLEVAVFWVLDGHQPPSSGHDDGLIWRRTLLTSTCVGG